MDHSASSCLPRSGTAANSSRTSSGTKNGSSDGQPSACFVSLTSSTPSGEPWDAELSCLLGEPKPM